MLYRLEQALLSATLPVPFTLSTRQTVQINPARDSALDVRRFTKLVAEVKVHHHRRLTVCGDCIEALQQAVGLYRGDFLAGFSASPLFDEWLLAWRERLREQAIWALDALAAYHEQRGEWWKACAQLRRLLELEPWHEEAHQRLMIALAYDGQRSAALAQYKHCCRILARDLDASPAAETIALAFRLRCGPLGLWPRPPFIVPAIETPMLGRAEALKAIARRLAAPTGRLLTLTGPGGSGKTRLAIAAAAVERGTFANGVFFVPLVSVTDEGSLVAAIADSLTLPLAAGKSAPLSALCAFLNTRELLLVLDNFEHLVESTPLLGILLAAAPDLRIIVTSRIPLYGLDEVVLRVEGLEPAPTIDARQPADEPAVQLFLQAARQIAPSFAPDADGLEAISATCRALDGLPLAIMLAAGSAAQLGPGATLDFIPADLDAMETELRGLPTRHRSARSLFESSWRMLHDEQQRLLTHCTIFAGSFSSEAAAIVAAVEGSDRTTSSQLAGRTLEALADYALLQRHGPDRYMLYPLVRQFAVERHAQLPAAAREASRTRHRAYYLSMVAPHASSIVSSAEQPAIELLHIELALMGTATRRLLDATLQIAQTIDYSYGEGDTLNKLALMEISMGFHGEALARARVALAIYRADAPTPVRASA